jgi:hypothetical protein
MSAWKEGRIVRRTLPLGDDAVIVQELESYGDGWAVCSSSVHEDDVADGRWGRTVGLREAKMLADRHVDELRKTWAAEGRT